MSILRCFDNLCVLAMTIWSIHLFPSSSWNCCQNCWPQCWVSRLIHVDIYTLHIISILICIKIDMYYIYIIYIYILHIYILHIFILHIHIINTDIYRRLEVDFVPFRSSKHDSWCHGIPERWPWVAVNHMDPKKNIPLLDDPVLGSWWSLKQRISGLIPILMDDGFHSHFSDFSRWIW